MKSRDLKSGDESINTTAARSMPRKKVLKTELPLKTVDTFVKEFEKVHTIKAAEKVLQGAGVHIDKLKRFLEKRPQPSAPSGSIQYTISLLTTLAIVLENYAFEYGPKPNWGYRDKDRDFILEGISEASKANDFIPALKNALRALRIDNKRVDHFSELAKKTLDKLQTTNPETNIHDLQRLASLIVLNAFSAREVHPDFPTKKNEDPRLVGPSTSRGAAKKEGTAAKTIDQVIEEQRRKQGDSSSSKKPRTEKASSSKKLTPAKKTTVKIEEKPAGEARSGRGRGRPRKQIAPDTHPPDPEEAAKIKKRDNALSAQSLHHIAFRAGAEAHEQSNTDKEALYATLRRAAEHFIKFLIPEDADDINYEFVAHLSRELGFDLPASSKNDLRRCPQPTKKPVARGGTRKRSNEHKVAHEQHSLLHHRYDCVYFNYNDFQNWVNDVFPGKRIDRSGVTALMLVTQDFLTDLISASLEVEKVGHKGKTQPKVRGKSAHAVVHNVFENRMTHALHALGTRNRLIAMKQPNSQEEFEDIKLLGPKTFIT